MKLKKILTASALSLAVSSSIFAACSADISMGGKTITHIGTDSADTKYNVATQGDLLAASRFELSKITNKSVNSIKDANQFCADLDDSGAVDGTASNKGWRLPTIEEATQFMGKESNTIDISGKAYVGTTATAPTAGSAIWVATPIITTNYSTPNPSVWQAVKLNGGWSYAAYDKATYYAACVR